MGSVNAAEWLKRFNHRPHINLICACRRVGWRREELQNLVSAVNNEKVLIKEEYFANMSWC